MEKSQIKGYLFEVIIGKLLESVGYRWEISSGNRKLKGRGARHEIDAIGIGNGVIPFVNNVRLLAEAKYESSGHVGLPIIRNMFGVLTDINESYIPGGKSIATKLLGKRETNCAVIFSNRDFARDAVNYGYAHNIYLVSYKGNPVMEKIINDFESLCGFIRFDYLTQGKNQLKRWFGNTLSGDGPIEGDVHLFDNLHEPDLLQSILGLRNSIDSTSSIMGFIGGSYPLHIMSEGGNIINEFREYGHNGVLKVGYYFDVIGNNLKFWFELNSGGNAFFVLPKYLFPPRKIRERNLREEKDEYLKNITIPLVNNGVVTILRLEFDRSLIRTERS